MMKKQKDAGEIDQKAAEYVLLSYHHYHHFKDVLDYIDVGSIWNNIAKIIPFQVAGTLLKGFQQRGHKC